jgi:TfoX/Sxy family transcriptional regulator of competence genes
VPVTASFRAFVLEQLEQATRDIRDKRMFGGVGIYAGELFFALIDNDTLYFKVDDETRPTFVAAGMKPFSPYGPEGETMHYFEVPIGVLEDVDALQSWVADAVAVAGRAKQKPRTRARKSR